MKKLLIILITLFFISCGQPEVETGLDTNLETETWPDVDTSIQADQILTPSQINFDDYTGDMPDYYGKVLRVADGDTFYVDWFTEDSMGVRIKGIDTPETVDRRTDVQFWGPEASEYAKEVLSPGTIVRLDFNGNITGPFGRLLAYVYYWDGDEWVYYNEQALRDGMAFVYPDYRFDYIEEFLEYQAHAIENENGMWADYDSIENEVVRNVEELFNHPKAGWFRADTRRENPDLYEELSN